MTSALRVLYVVICGVSNAASSYDFINDVIDDGWEVCAIVTPAGSKFVDTERLAARTGHPVRCTFKDPNSPDVLPPGNAYVAAPASFNTVNKLSNGVSDTLAVGILCEAMGNQQPVIVAPWMNRALANHSAYARSIQNLQNDGVRVVLTDRTKPGKSLTDPGGPFPWTDVLAEVRKLPEAFDRPQIASPTPAAIRRQPEPAPRLLYQTRQAYPDTRQGRPDTCWEDSMTATTAPHHDMTLLCSFCGKSQDQVAQLIAGPGPAICDECVHLCNDVLAGRRPEGIRSWDDQSDEELIATMVRVASLRHHVDRAVGRIARLLRTRGTTWTVIGGALGITRQSAWERFSGED